MVDRAIIHAQHAPFEIEVKDNSPANMYVKRVLLNGKELDAPFISHEEIARGGKLVFEMSDTH